MAILPDASRQSVTKSAPSSGIALRFSALDIFSQSTDSGKEQGDHPDTRRCDGPSPPTPMRNRPVRGSAFGRLAARVEVPSQDHSASSAMGPRASLQRGSVQNSEGLSKFLVDTWPRQTPAQIHQAAVEMYPDSVVAPRSFHERDARCVARHSLDTLCVPMLASLFLHAPDHVQQQRLELIIIQRFQGSQQRVSI
eukprot:CAMPEP_0194527956 /NCGR_PEP_ID=MMETSP0253-20130528/64235_1 /TAXON_ID=2966 /ORGANISM="Noctiluca scintillans" /LENGTH=194 /DNA_ID=CAMNT_0039372961 /DNA_START=732 /DNA_END=1318 /DNA_ORIENTATION=-